MYENQYLDTYHIPLGSVVVFSQNTACTSNGEMVHPPAGFPPESTMVQQQIATTDTPENPPNQTIRKNDHELLRISAMLVVSIGMLGAICYGVYALGRLIYCSLVYCGD
jgi:hypothetical protein